MKARPAKKHWIFNTAKVGIRSAGQFGAWGNGPRKHGSGKSKSKKSNTLHLQRPIIYCKI